MKNRILIIDINILVFTLNIYTRSLFFLCLPQAILTLFIGVFFNIRKKEYLAQSFLFSFLGLILVSFTWIAYLIIISIATIT